MDVPSDFAGRLKLALKVVNLSPAALGAAVGVDKSVVSRWLSGRVAPSGHNLSRIGAEIARLRPGFSTLSFEAPPAAFLAVLGVGALSAAPAANSSTPGGIVLPFNAIEDARNETARRGVEYFGHYSMYYWSFTQPGRVVRMALMLRPKDGLIEARYGANGFEFGGWALLLMNRLYIQFAEQRYQAMVFMVTNPGQQPAARRITGLLMGPSDGMMVPTVSPFVMDRVGPVTGDEAQDVADFNRAQDFDPFADGAEVPADVREALVRQVTVTNTPQEGQMSLLRMNPA
ncbi:helix-turn-helix domain-containing protein [Tabrizicola sp. J26]|uniref:helix-turn-helix domain-containing protein n=1 Tax=Alitabrizicola rongguiensis TaxID=2909234 RepID=UPI001F32DDCF|nr:helix-turn-helix transcriptional regulator [Tabrizicola rongguiensis]MCF1708626.1 helix-turn-helix domain-containing protein [Tabrizicola rongguiensis]